VTPQEEQLIRNLADRVNSTKLQEKDDDAEALLQSSFGSNPDALYILAQAVLVQNFALEQAKSQVADMQQQVQQAKQAQQPAHATSFLGGLFGHRDPEPVAPAQQPQYQQAAPAQYTEQPFQPVRQVGPAAGYPAGAAPAYAVAQQPQYAPVAMGQPSFLRGAMQTAAGVAAGALAFEGVESILHGFSHPGYGFGGPAGFGMGPGFGGGGFERPVEETVVNNYYDQPGGQAGGQDFGRRDAGEERHFNDDSGQHEIHDSSDRNSGDQGQAQFNDASYNPQGNDTQQNNDAQLDESSYNPPDPYLRQDPQAGFDQGSDQSNYDPGSDQGGFDQASNDPGQDSGGFGDSGGFDDGGGGGFDSGGGDFS
jgi:uncharacterized protein